VFTTQRSVRFREMEYAVPLDELASAFREVRELVDASGWRIEFPIEVRVAPDDRWLSTAYARDSGYIAVHRYWRADHRAYFAAVEEIMRAHAGRPHWGKLHTLDAAALRERYPRFDDFLRCATASTPRACSATPISTASSAREGLSRTCPDGEPLGVLAAADDVPSRR
jgi:FAD/FMN-containing dehydrogenase